MKNSKYFWKCAGVRAIKTMAQTGVATLSGAVVFSQVDWKVWLSTVALASVLSILTSMAGLPEVKAEGTDK